MNATLPINYSNAHAFRATQQAPAQQAPAQQAEAADVAPQDFDEGKVTWGEAFEGLASAVAVAGIETVGNTASSLVNLPKATYHAYRAALLTPQIGPVLKTCIALTLPAAVVAAPVLTALGSFGFGLWRGFTEGVEHGIGKAVQQGVDDVKYFHKDMAGQLVKAMSEYEIDELPPGEEPFDISIVGGAKGLAAGVTAGAIDGVGIGASTLIHTPRAAFKAGKALWESDAALPLKVIGTALIPPTAVIAAPLGLVGGALYGLATGAHAGYTKGYGEAVSNAVETVGDFNKMVHEGLNEM